MSADDATNAFAEEAEDTRERIAATIDELQDRLDPRRIVSDAAASVRSGGEDLINQGVALAKAHPAVLAGAALAVGLVLLGRDRLKSATVDLGDSADVYSDYDDNYTSAEPAGERFALLREDASARIGDNPLIAVVVGLAAGALLGALFPETQRERRLLGASSDRVKAAAKAAARAAQDELATARAKVADVTGHAKAAVHSVVDAAKAELG